jgi:5'-nucleotidase/UDP-sugar diphosphatase
MQQLGFDAMAVGNHEFDFGPEVLAGSLDAAFGNGGVPLLSANLDMSGYPALETWVRPSVLKDVGGVKVGILGMTVPTDPMAQPAPVVIMGGDDPGVVLQIAGETALALRSAGAQVVICLSHLGLAYDEAIAENVPGIDLIVGGHNHYSFPTPLSFINPSGCRTLILQAGCDYREVGRLRMTYDSGVLTFGDYDLVPVDASVGPDPEAGAMVEQLKAGIVAKYGDVYHDVLARAVTDVGTGTEPRSPFRDSPMGDLLTDATRADTGTDIAIAANGLIAEDIPRGPIVGADVFRSVSCGYDPDTGLGLKLATFDITGAQLLQGLEAGLAYLGIDDDVFLQVAGMSFAYDSRRPAGERVLQRSVVVGHRRLDPDATYSATANLAIVGLLPLMGVSMTDVQPLSDLEYTVLRGHIVGLKVVRTRSDGRIVDVAQLPHPELRPVRRRTQ